MKLDEYRRKRDFRRTAEPAGAGEADEAADGLVFVIQKHAASHLHYDLRLELDGVMLSWAVPKGPSLDPSVKRLAMQVEDHPIEYNTFEGTIPQGEYGGGTVMLWDRGTYRPDEVPPGADEATAVRRGIRAGKLSFTLFGERLRGSFALIRTDRGPKPKWLLMKHRDAEADADSDITEDVVTSVVSGRTMEEIAAGSGRVWRSNRGGRSGGEERKPAPPASAATDVIEPMKPTPARSLPDDDGWTFEPWRGGERVLAYVASDAARLVDARGRDVTAKHRTVAESLAALSSRLERPFVLDGEFEPAGAGRATFFAADLLLDGGEVLLERPWQERRAALESLLRRRRVRNVKRQETVASGRTMLGRAERAGWPGMFARRLDAPYEPGVEADGFLRIPRH